MKKLSQEEIDALVRGEGLIEIEFDEDVDPREALVLLRNIGGGFIATSEQTFRVSKSLLEALISRGYVVKEIIEDTSH